MEIYSDGYNFCGWKSRKYKTYINTDYYIAEIRSVFEKKILPPPPKKTLIVVLTSRTYSGVCSRSHYISCYVVCKG